MKLTVEMDNTQENIDGLEKAAERHGVIWFNLPETSMYWCYIDIVGTREAIENFLKDEEFGYCVICDVFNEAMYNELCSEITEE